MNSRINFEIAKLLDDKNYPFEFATVGEVERVPLNIPTITEVVMWLYEKHGIFIQPFTIGEEGKMKFYTKLIVNDNGWVKIKHQISTIYNSPTEAYEAAIAHTLKNLI